MGGTVDNIIVKNATMVVAGYGVAEGSGTDIGALVGGVTVADAKEFKEISGDCFLGPVIIALVGKKMTVKCSMEESSLENLRIALGQASTQLVTTTLSIGADATTQYLTLYINGDAVSGGTRKYTFYKCVFTGTGSHAYKKGEAALVEAEFTVLEDTSKSTGERFGKVEDTSTDTTAPTIAMSTPSDDATWAVKTLLTPLVWTITETNAIDENTIVYGNTFTIIDTTMPGSAVLKAGTLTYNPLTKTVSFTPSVAWTTAHTFQVIVTTGLSDMAGNHLAAPRITQFTID